MTSFYPHTTYAEDQPQAHQILYLHVIRAASMMGSAIGLLTAPASLAVSRYRHGTPFTSSTLIPQLLRHSGRGLIIGSFAGGLMTWGRMLGREEIEWQDRSWRLQENKGQVDTDKWIMGTSVAGAAAGLLATRRGAVPLGSGQAVLGGAGVGTASGVGYMIASFAREQKPA
ncbi:hypothetical protein EJ04DRAFT_510261 [Polyplosphaeria fusca]|uniref:Uncharacterized protein n=1 Tax=Polyplosphaeria fusca TaxID=682080 RepID=A0A9P4R1D0_9PLEO|nr:hypothetical protein EJ04DRAFT_510261 [Polyplosphaeria fusca]